MNTAICNWTPVPCATRSWKRRSPRLQALHAAADEAPALVDYYRYIRSVEWRQKAEAAKARAGNRCQVCNHSRTEVQLDAHHRT